ncbi:MAG: RNA methyltransferase [Chitinophagales bacterium]|nr:RNA methyltransferase [Chitinophagales bacterium]
MRKLKLDELNRLSTTEYQQTNKLPIIVVVDNVRSAMNVGSIFRTCDAFLIEAIYLVGITAQPPNREILKTALGATESVDWQYFENIRSVIDELKSNDYQILAIEQSDASVLLHDFEIDKHQKYALVLGNEVDGVSNEFINNCTACIEIPQYGTKHSLNVSVCAGIVIWHFASSLME